MYSTLDIFDDLLGMRNWFDRYFDEIPAQRRTVDYPYINLYEKDHRMEIKLIAPGVKKEDLNIYLTDNTLHIEGEKKRDHADSRYIREERDFGKFKKSVKLPYMVDNNKIEAEMKDGILTIRLVMSEDAKPKKIEIH